MKKLMILLLFFSWKLQAQTPPAAPGLEFFCELQVELDPAMTVGQTPRGLRRIIPIIGGTVTGPAVNGTIIKGGADWQFIREDGTAELEAHYQFKTDDGVLIYIKNTGIRVASPEVAARIARGEVVPDTEYYFRAVPQFEAPEGKYYWMNNSIFLCKGVKNPDNVSIFVWRVL